MEALGYVLRATGVSHMEVMKGLERARDTQVLADFSIWKLSRWAISIRVWLSRRFLLEIYANIKWISFWKMASLCSLLRTTSWQVMDKMEDVNTGGQGSFSSKGNTATVTSFSRPRDCKQVLAAIPGGQVGNLDRGGFPWNLLFQAAQNSSPH